MLGEVPHSEIIKILKMGVPENSIINKKADSEEIRSISLSEH